MAIPSPMTRWLIAALLVATTTGCSRRIDEDPPIPEHRIDPCEMWCSMMFEPECRPQEVAVQTEEECFDACAIADHVWAPVDGHDDCAATYIPYVDCLASLSCNERYEHFALVNVVQPEEQSSCGELFAAQLDCQTAHY